MIYLLGGYIWLFVHRPFEVWPSLGVLQIERGYMLLLMLAWLVTPGKGFRLNRIHLALGLFALVMASTWLLSPYADVPGVSDVVENYFKVAVFYVLVVTTVRDERSLRLLLLLFLCAVGVYMMHSLFEYSRGRYQFRMGTSRMTGVDVTYGDPNAFSATLLYTLPLTLPFWFEQPRRVPRWLLAGFTLLVAGCVLLTGSRAGFLGLCLIGSILLWVSCRGKGPLLLFGGMAALLLAVVLTTVLGEDLQNRYLTIVDPSRGPQNAQDSALGRVAGLLNGIDAWQRSPITGHGPGSFAHATGGGFGAHNLYGQVLAEMGGVGAVALGGVLLAFLLNWLEIRRLYRDPWLNPAGDPSAIPPDLAYHVGRGVTINVFLLLLMGFAGHNLFRYQWQWFAAFQVIALHCVRSRVESAQAAYAWPYLLPT